MDELVADIVVVVVVCTPCVLPHFGGRLAKSPAFFLTFGNLPWRSAVTRWLGVGGPLRLSRSWVRMTSDGVLRFDE
jgi:hypothetical protein